LALTSGFAQADVRSTQLFDRLREAPDAAQAAQAESRIWQYWMHHDNDEVNARFARGVQSLAAGDFTAAVRQFSQVLQIAPEFSEAWNKRATAYYLMDDLSASVADIERTLVLEPRHFGALSGLGLIFLSRGDLQGALAAFERVLLIYPRSESALFHVQQLRRSIRKHSI
jgi:tetratricopeptide (TPR) repeat protein